MVNIFLSYCHKDDVLSRKVYQEIKLLEKANDIEIWLDSKCCPGNELFGTIDERLNSSDIGILLLSSSFYSSPSCSKEKEKFIHKRTIEGTKVLFITIDDCNWKDDPEIKTNKALNYDAIPLSSLSEEKLVIELGNIKDRLNDVINSVKKIKSLSINTIFAKYIDSSDIFEKTHGGKNTLQLSDIFVYPELKYFDEKKDDQVIFSSKNLIAEKFSDKQIMISGANQSGKTALCKRVFYDLQGKLFIPIYLDGTKDLSGDIFNVLTNNLKEEYLLNEEINDAKTFLKDNKENIVILIDDFYLSKSRENLSGRIGQFTHIILFVDDIFPIEYGSNNLENKINSLIIKELSPSLRNELVEKWLNLDSDIRSAPENDKFALIDQKTEDINSVINKANKGGIFPSYPFWILSILVNTETIHKPIDQQISSYGYCYETLITISLARIGLRSDTEIGGFLQFFSYFAYQMFKNDSYELSNQEFSKILAEYKSRYYLPIKNEDAFIKKLDESNFFSKTSIGNRKFEYIYMYYFFVAKYLSDNIDDHKDEITNLIANIHKDSNAYIVIFLAHFTTSKWLIDELQRNALNVFKNDLPATLTALDIKFMDENSDAIIQASLPQKTNSAKIERQKRLQQQDELESEYTGEVDECEKDSAGIYELRSAIKIVEVMGMIAKNRATSMQKPQMIDLVHSAINVNLRCISSFLCLIKDQETQDMIIQFLTDQLTKEKEKNIKFNPQNSEDFVRTVFWQLNFIYVLTILLKTIDSIGSKQVIQILSDIQTEDKSPSLEIIKQGMSMWYEKNIDLRAIVDDFKSKEFSKTAKSVMGYLIANHCKMHQTDFREKQRISAKLGIRIEGVKEGNSFYKNGK